MDRWAKSRFLMTMVLNQIHYYITTKCPEKLSTPTELWRFSQSYRRAKNTTQSRHIDIRARGGKHRTQFDTSLATGARSTYVTRSRGPSADFSSHSPVNIPQPDAADAWAAAELLAYGGGFLMLRLLTFLSPVRRIHGRLIWL